MQWALAIVALSLIGFGVISRRVDGTPITPAIIFVGVGLVVGTQALDLLDTSPTGEAVKVLADATLTLVLFADASRIDLRTLRRESAVPARLLGVGLPLTIALGALIGVMLFGGLSVPEAARSCRAACPDRRSTRPGRRHRAPAAVSDPPGSQRRERPQRRDLRAAPLHRAGGRRGRCRRGWCDARGSAGGRGDRIRDSWRAPSQASSPPRSRLRSSSRRLIEPSWLQIIPVAGAALAYGVAAPLGGSGFIAAFVRAWPSAPCAGRRSHGEVTLLTGELGELLERRHLPGLRSSAALAGSRRPHLANRRSTRPQA